MPRTSHFIRIAASAGVCCHGAMVLTRMGSHATPIVAQTCVHGVADERICAVSMQMVMMGQLMHALSAATEQQTAGLESYVNT
jgi:hypothetical protein